jgi:hypothetical protein
MAAAPYALVLQELDDRIGYFAVDFHGARIVKRSRDPEHDAARALLKMGLQGKAETIDAKTGKPRLRFDIEAFARTEHVEGAHGPYMRKYSPPKGIANPATAPASALKPPGGTLIAPTPPKPLGRGVSDDPDGASA